MTTYPQLAYYYQHRDYKLEYQKNYYRQNKDKIAEYYKNYYKSKKCSLEHNNIKNKEKNCEEKTFSVRHGNFIVTFS